MNRKYILITGGNGQLGSCLKKYVESINSDFEFIFLGHAELDITNEDSVLGNIKKYGPENVYCIINCAAYKNCDLAEINKDLAMSINTDGPRVLARICSEYSIKLVHISTDFLSPKNQNVPLKCIPVDKDMCCNVYGSTKCAGEMAVINEYNKKMSQNYCIIHTSWLYSEFCSNFAKTIIDKIKDGNTVNVVDDQVGTPTNANDLAKFIIECVVYKNISGIINYRNHGITSWYDFAKCIEEAYNLYSGNNFNVIRPCSEYYNMRQAKRPNYSVLDIRITETYCDIPYWRDSVFECVKEIVKNG